MTENS